MKQAQSNRFPINFADPETWLNSVITEFVHLTGKRLVVEGAYHSLLITGYNAGYDPKSMADELAKRIRAN